MPTIQVKHVPDEVHAVLRDRAARAGKSLQQYLLERLTEEAETVPVDELFERIERGAGGRSGARLDVDEVVAAIRADRDRR